VVAGVHVLPLLAMPQILGDVGMLVPVQLGVMVWVWAMANQRVALPARTPPRSPVQLLAVDRQVDRQPPDNWGPGWTALDGYTRPDQHGSTGR
jgi:hypothetical protein